MENIYRATENLPKVFIVIVNHNGRATLAGVLTELFRCDYPNLEIVLVDNGSTDGSIEGIRGNFPRVTLIKNSENIGVAAGMNVGISYALERGAVYLWLLRQSVSNLKDLLPELVYEMEKDKQIGLSGPVRVNANHAILFSGGRINWLKMEFKTKKNRLEENYFRSSYLLGGAVLVRAGVFRKTGLLNKDYFTYYGEMELSFKAKKAGYKLLISPKVQVVYSEEAGDKSEKEKYWTALSTMIFFKYNTPMYLMPWTIIFFLTSFLKNWMDVLFFKKKEAELMRRVYRDFYFQKDAS